MHESLVKEKSALFKSMLASKNLQQPIRKPSEGHHWIRVLAAELALRLENARKDNRTLWPKSIVLHVRQGEFSTRISYCQLDFIIFSTGYKLARSKQSRFPFTNDVNVDYVAAAGDKLWKELAEGLNGSMKITNIQLAFTGLEDADPHQRSIEGFLKTRAPEDQAPKRSRADDEGDLGFQSEAGPSKLPPSQPSNSNDTSVIGSFTCPRCSKHITLPESTLDNDNGHDTGAAAMERIRQEHDDFHFAQDLARSTGKSEGSRIPIVVSKKRRKESEGIAKYFRPV
jgi:DNA polymerase eta